MKLAIYCPSVFNVHRGTETFVKNVCKLLGEYHKVDLISGGGGSGYRAANVKIFEYPYIQREEMAGELSCKFTLESATFFISAANHFKEHSYDLIHAQFPFDLVLKSVARDPLLLHVHGDPAKFSRILKSVKADGYTACSKHIAESVQEIVGEKVYPVYGGVDVNFFKPSPKLKKDGEMIIMSLGVLDLDKGLGYLLKAFKEIERKDKKIHLWIGGKGPDEEKVRMLVRKLKLKNVKFLGFVDQKMLPAVYSTADAFILPSLSEPFGITMLESMACGTPVIATNVGGPKELITKDIGFLIKPKSEKEIVKAVLGLKNFDLDRMGRKAREKIVKKFTWEETVKSLLKAYKRVGK